MVISEGAANIQHMGWIQYHAPMVESCVNACRRMWDGWSSYLHTGRGAVQQRQPEIGGRALGEGAGARNDDGEPRSPQRSFGRKETGTATLLETRLKNV